MPADTWHQPVDEDEMPVDETAPSLLVLDDDCLLNILDRCDVEMLSNVYDTCERLRSLVQREAKSRPLQRIILKISPIASLRKTRQLLRFVGDIVEDLKLEFSYYQKPNNLERYLFKIAQYVNGKIERLTIIHLHFTDNLLDVLKPLFERVKVFKMWSQQYDFDYDIDYRSLLPNAVKFKMLQNMTFVRSTGPWLHLENLSLHQNQHLEGVTVEQLLKHNRQLKTLNICLDDMEQNFRSISSYGTNIEKLTIGNMYPSTNGERVGLFQNLPTLRILKLIDLESELFREVLEAATNLSGLTHLKLHVYAENADEVDVHLSDEGMKRIANKLIKLSVLYIGNVGVTDRLIIDLVRAMPNLVELGLDLKDDIPTDFQDQLNSARSKATANNEQQKVLTIIINPFAVNSPREARLVASQPLIKFKKLFSIDPYSQFAL